MPPSDKFWNKIAVKYSKSPISDMQAYEEKLKRTQDLFRKEMDVLEFGCGTGSTALIHAPFVNHITASDISASMLEIARSKATDAGLDNLTFVHSSFEDLAAEPSSFDVVMGHSILHLLEDRAFAIQKAYDLLKPGGYFVTSTACLTGHMKLLKGVLPLGRLFGLLPYVSFFSEDDLIKGIKEPGFSIEQSWQPAKGKSLFVVARKPG